MFTAMFIATFIAVEAMRHGPTTGAMSGGMPSR
jgi:hypothetical protein